MSRTAVPTPKIAGWSWWRGLPGPAAWAASGAARAAMAAAVRRRRMAEDFAVAAS